MNMISFNNLEGTLWAEVEKSEDSALLENDFANIVAKALSVSGRGNRGYRLIAMSEYTAKNSEDRISREIFRIVGYEYEGHDYIAIVDHEIEFDEMIDDFEKQVSSHCLHLDGEHITEMVSDIHDWLREHWDYSHDQIIDVIETAIRDLDSEWDVVISDDSGATTIVRRNRAEAA